MTPTAPPHVCATAIAAFTWLGFSTPQRAPAPEDLPPPIIASVASMSPNPPSGPQAVTAVVDGVPVTLPFGRARWDEPFVQIELASAPLACGADAPQDAYLLSFPLPAGPGRRFYAGQRIELPGEIVTRARATGRPRVTIEVEGASAEEGWARGRVETALAEPGGETYLVHGLEARGRFDLRLCPGGTASPPDEARGTFEYRVALVDLEIDRATGKRRLASLSFHADARVGCRDREIGEEAGSLSLDSISGARNEHAVRGLPQPAVPSYFQRDPGDTCPGSAVGIPGGPRAWVTFEDLRLEPGARVRGRVHASPLPVPAGRAEQGGLFEAVVCGL